MGAFLPVLADPDGAWKMFIGSACGGSDDERNGDGYWWVGVGGQGQGVKCERGEVGMVQYHATWMSGNPASDLIRSSPFGGPNTTSTFTSSCVRVYECWMHA